MQLKQTEVGNKYTQRLAASNNYPTDLAVKPNGARIIQLTFWLNRFFVSQWPAWENGIPYAILDLSPAIQFTFSRGSHSFISHKIDCNGTARSRHDTFSWQHNLSTKNQWWAQWRELFYWEWSWWQCLYRLAGVAGQGLGMMMGMAVVDTITTEAVAIMKEDKSCLFQGRDVSSKTLLSGVPSWNDLSELFVLWPLPSVR